MPYKNMEDQVAANKRYRERKSAESDAVKAEMEIWEEIRRSLPPIMLRGVKTDEEEWREIDQGYQRKIANDVSISMFDKIVFHSYIPPLKDLENMTLEQLREVNRAYDAKTAREASRAENNKLTAGRYDPETKTWHGGKPDVDIDAADNKSFTAGKWNPEKKRYEK